MRKLRQFVLVCRDQKNVNKIMPGFEQNEGTNLKLKIASRLEAERSEILNSGSTQHLKTLFNESFFRLLLTNVNTAFCQFFRELGHKLKTEKCTSF